MEAEDWDEEGFRASVGANLADGRFRLVIAVDQVTEELARVVRFLNEHTNPELQILALELGYVADAGVEILVPTLYGRESAEEKPPTGRRWDEARVFAALSECCSAAGFAVARRLYDFAHSRSASFNWGAGDHALVTARLPIRGKKIGVFSLYEWPKGTGLLSINFVYMTGTVPPEVLKALVDRLRTVPGLAQPLQGLEQAEFRKLPSFSLETVAAQPDAVETIEAALADLLTSTAAS